MKTSEATLRRLRQAEAFTLLELLVTIGILAVLATLAVPSLARINPASKMTQCHNNTRRLMMAWQMYAYDNSDGLVINYHGGNSQGGNFDPRVGPAWCEGWLDWTTGTDNTNVAFLLTSRYAKFAPYIGQQPETFKCPSDQYLSPTQRALGWTQRARSYSLSVGLGQGNAESGPWQTVYRHVTNIVDFLYPTPAETWAFTEDHPDAMNDPAFFCPSSTTFIDTPATYHNGGCSFGFADGHVELHHWVASLTTPRAQTVAARDGAYLNAAISGPPGDADIHWVSFHSQRKTANSY